jgi:hypothetical protein
VIEEETDPETETETEDVIILTGIVKEDESEGED